MTHVAIHAQCALRTSSRDMLMTGLPASSYKLIKHYMLTLMTRTLSTCALSYVPHQSHFSFALRHLINRIPFPKSKQIPFEDLHVG